jgi:hypothetical protein
MEDGDTIDVRVSIRHSRGGCPLPPQQTLPNIHYLVQEQPSDVSATGSLTQQLPRRTAPALISMTLKDCNGHEIALRMKKTAKMSRPMTSFAADVGREVKECRFMIDGQRINGEDTPESVSATSHKHCQG